MKLGSVYDAAAGRQSRSALVAMGAFWASLVRFLLSGTEIRMAGGYMFHFAPVDATLLVAFMAPCFALYWGRRFTDSKAYPTLAGISGIATANPSPCPPGTSQPVG